jgi:hypothetical protein
MSIVIRLSVKEELKALPIILRHSPGTVLPNRTYVVSHESVLALDEAGIRFTTLGAATSHPRMEGVPAGERI